MAEEAASTAHYIKTAVQTLTGILPVTLSLSSFSISNGSLTEIIVQFSGHFVAVHASLRGF